MEKAHYLGVKKNCHPFNIPSFLKGNFLLITNMDMKIGSYGMPSNVPKKTAQNGHFWECRPQILYFLMT